MDTSNFQDLGNSPISPPSNNLQAGEFAKPSDFSPVALNPAATFNSHLKIFKFQVSNKLGDSVREQITADSLADAVVKLQSMVSTWGVFWFNAQIKFDLPGKEENQNKWIYSGDSSAAANSESPHTITSGLLSHSGNLGL